MLVLQNEEEPKNNEIEEINNPLQLSILVHSHYQEDEEQQCEKQDDKLKDERMDKRSSVLRCIDPICCCAVMSFSFCVILVGVIFLSMQYKL